jgi:hypothetical protein
MLLEAEQRFDVAVKAMESVRGKVEGALKILLCVGRGTVH